MIYFNLLRWYWEYETLFGLNIAVNSNECLLTRMQEMSLDYHFTVEQEVGSATHAFFGFNGESKVVDQVIKLPMMLATIYIVIIRVGKSKWNFQFIISKLFFFNKKQYSKFRKHSELGIGFQISKLSRNWWNMENSSNKRSRRVERQNHSRGHGSCCSCWSQGLEISLLGRSPGSFFFF